MNETIKRAIFAAAWVFLSKNAALAQSCPERTIAGIRCVNNVVNMSEHDKFPLTDKFSKDGVQLIIHRATRGDNYLDKSYGRRVKETRALNIDIGAYHFAMSEGFSDKIEQGLFKNDPVKQAQCFVNSVRQHKPMDSSKILLVFDLECYGKNEKSHISLHAAAKAIEEIYRLTGVYPGLYTGAYFINEHMTHKGLKELLDPQNATQIKDTLSKCWLWIARYEKEPEALPTYSPWQNWTMWQYTTNLSELDALKKKPSKELRHIIGGVSGEFNYLALSDSSYQKWYNDHAWNYQLKASPDRLSQQ